MSPILFLDHASAKKKMEESEARELALGLIATLRAVKKVNKKVSLNSEQPLSQSLISESFTLSSVLGGSKYHEEWLFIRDLAARSPIDKGQELQNLDLTLVEVTTTVNKQKSEALKWAWAMQTATVSYNCLEDWRESYVSIGHSTLTDSCELLQGSAEVKNASTKEHAEVHREWLTMLLEENYSSPHEFWKAREDDLPGLVLIPRVEGDLEQLFQGNVAAWGQATNVLKELSKAATAWDPNAPTPAFRTLTTPESETRSKLCYWFDPLTQKQELFEWHARYTGNVAGRIHFRIDRKARCLVVAYVGQKLRLL